jgi:surface antigen
MPCVVSPYGTTGTAANWCPGYNWGTIPNNTTDASELSPYGYDYRNCTDYVAWKLSTLGVKPAQYKGLGNGNTWGTYAASHGLTDDDTPKVGSVAVSISGKDGHVAFVTGVSGTTITVAQYNQGMDGNYSTQSGTATGLGFSSFVHFEKYEMPGTDGTGVYDPSDYSFHLRNSLSSGPSDYAFVRGAPGDIPLVGNWDGQGGDGTGVYDPSDYSFHLRNSLSSGPSDYAFVRGGPGDIPLVGNWDGQGGDGIGYYDPSDGSFHLRNSLSSGASDYAFVFGPPHMIPLVGNWDGQGGDGIGYYDPSDYSFHLRNSLSSGPSDYAFVRGGPGDIPLVGNWDGQLYPKNSRLSTGDGG